MKVTNGDPMTVGCCKYHNCEPVAKNLNHDHMTMGHYNGRNFEDCIRLLVQRHCNFEQLLKEWLFTESICIHKMRFFTSLLINATVFIHTYLMVICSCFRGRGNSGYEIKILVCKLGVCYT